MEDKITENNETEPEIQAPADLSEDAVEENSAAADVMQPAAGEETDFFEDRKTGAGFDPAKNIERLLDVEMNVTVRFGQTEIPLREAINFGIGTMIELNRSVDEPVELLINNYPFARGEVVVIDGYYGVRVTEIGTPEERSRTLLKNAAY